jgi:hypothetical protein
VRRERRSKPPTTHVLWVHLRDVDPLVWRRLDLRSDTNLAVLHHVLQAAFGWTDRHMHQFQIGHDAHRDERVVPSHEHVGDQGVTLEHVLSRRGSRLIYEYDPAEGWEVVVRVEEIVVRAPSDGVPGVARLLDGARAAPREGCGWGERRRNARRASYDPLPLEGDESIALAWNDYDAEEFDFEACARALALPPTWNPSLEEDDPWPDLELFDDDGAVGADGDAALPRGGESDAHRTNLMTDEDVAQEVSRLAYDADCDSHLRDWFEFDPAVRAAAVAAFHRRAGHDVGEDAQAHFLTHVSVEDQLTLNDAPLVRATLERLMDEDVSRHAALHALGSVLHEVRREIEERGEPPDPSSLAAWYAALDPRDWSSPAP